MELESAILRLRALTVLLGISRTTVWRRVKNGEIPAPIRLGGTKSQAIGWRRTEIERWLADRPRATGEATAQ